MNSKQTNKKNMFNKLLVFFADEKNKSVWAGFSRLVKEIENFMGLNKQIDDAATTQSGVTTGITAEKNEWRTKMALTLVRNARKARVWAHDTGNGELEAVFNVQKDDFLKGKEEVVLPHAKNVQKALEDNQGSLGDVSVTPDDIAESGKAIGNFEAALGTPGAAESETKSGTEELVKLFADADSSLDVIDDLLIHEYEDSNPALVETYKSNRVIDDIGVHHTGIHASVTYADTKDPAQGVTIKIVELNKSAVTDIKGEAEIIRCKAGDYHVDITGDSIAPQSQIIKMERGHIVKLVVAVVKQ
jgi:hypothetical protein